MPLTDAQALELRQLLQTRYRATLEDVIARLPSDSDTRTHSMLGLVSDEGDLAVADQIVDMGVALRDRELEALQDVEAALQRLRSNTIAQCQDCLGAIPFERLRAYPSAKRCIDCQRRHERLFTARATPTL